MTQTKHKLKFSDGACSPIFSPIPLQGNRALNKLTEPIVSKNMAKAITLAPVGRGTAWGIPFTIGKKIILIKDSAFSATVMPFKATWLVFLHTSDIAIMEKNDQGFYASPFKGEGHLREHVADYIITYSNMSEVRAAIKLRHQIGMIQTRWGENCVEAVAHQKPYAIRAHHEQMYPYWGGSQCRARVQDRWEWTNWIWAWENPHPEKTITGICCEPVSGTIVLSAISAGNVTANPLRWRSRRKAIMVLPANVDFDPALDEKGLLAQIKLDMGQVISATPRLLYANEKWKTGYNNMLPEVLKKEVLIEYTAHSDAKFHLSNGNTISISALEKGEKFESVRVVTPALQKVKIRVIEKSSNKSVAVKLHIHGEAGEYLAPIDRHRIPNEAWFEDYSVDFTHQGIHHCTYIPGETYINLPLGKVYIEVSKGFEIKPVREVFAVTPSTNEITIPMEKVLPWREKGWVTADTHVHFLSPGSALLEGAAEGVNVVNLLASQWGELMTNVGDFNGKTTYGSREAGGDGEYLVRVGTENRQHILGHISLLGYDGSIILPMTTGGPDESALGDPIEILLTEWAQQCRKQGGVVILPHFPNPRMENAACIVNGDIDGVEMTSWGNLYGGIDPYSLSDWYRYLNCGYIVAAVGGTDKMAASTAVGTVRTYVRIEDNREFDYNAWKAAVRRGNTFVTYGPLLDFAVEGQPAGSRIKMNSKGGTVDVTWKIASVTMPMSRIDLVVNGEIKESRSVRADEDEGSWKVKIAKSSWIAILVRGHYEDKAEIITAHSSPVMIQIDGSEFFAAADALTILEQIEGSLAYLDTIGTRAGDVAYKRMRLVLQSSHRTLHNRLHQTGVYHDHTPATDHSEHHQG
jgi:hypothetical protein